MNTIISAYERALIQIVRALPPGRVSQIVDFARFIQSQTTHPQDTDTLDDEEGEDEIRVSEQKWDELLARPESQRLMLDMAREALAEDDADLTMEMAFDEDGNLVEPK